MQEWEEELDGNVGFAELGADFIGPRVPPAAYISFRPKSSRLKILGDTSFEDRIASIFGHVLVDDPLNWHHGKESPSARYTRIVGRKKFELNAPEFLRRALKQRPRNPTATASGFSQWIYSLHGNARGDDQDRSRGLSLEAELIARRRDAASIGNEAGLQSVRSDWELVHSGLHDAHGGSADYLTIEGLRVNGEPMRASPDLIYRHERRSEVIIVEIKYSRMEIPGNLWPNIWGQLWCYSQLEVARAARRITVVGEVWGENWYRERRHGSLADVCLRASVRRDPRVRAYDRFFHTLFAIYSGTDGSAPA
jgi:hypothetical protein